MLDVGCGPGRLARRLVAAGYRVRALDPSAAMLDLAARRITFEQGTIADALDRLRDHPFDALLCHNIPAGGMGLAYLSRATAEAPLDE